LFDYHLLSLIELMPNFRGIRLASSPSSASSFQHINVLGDDASTELTGVNDLSSQMERLVR
jgi:hypothetical protein